MSNANEIILESAGAGSSTGSAQAGSPIDPEQFKNLEQAFGKQGAELGEYRQFFADVSPLLDKLDKNPELVQLIIDGKIDPELIKAAAEGKLSTAEASKITSAHEAVKTALGAKGYENASEEKISKLMDDKLSAMKNEIQGSLRESEDLRSFEANVNDFIGRTPDFPEYAQAIDAWLNSHDITDIEVAYYAVKGQISETAAKKRAEEDKAEYEKNLAMNAGGGSTRTTYSGEGARNMIDSLIAGKSNPNVF